MNLVEVLCVCVCVCVCVCLLAFESDLLTNKEQKKKRRHVLSREAAASK